MKLTPPIEKYVTGNKITHSSFKKLSHHINDYSEDNLKRIFIKHGYINSTGKATPKAINTNLIDHCEGKILWNINNVRNFLNDNDNSQNRKTGANPMAGEEQWVDLDIIGTYFSVGKVTIGKWLDQLGLRVKEELKTNESGAHDMLDVANQAKQEQANGFIAKKASDKAIERGIARYLTVTNRKQQEIQILQWNLNKCKEILVKSGHPLNFDAKAALKGKGKNSNVRVKTLDDRAKELYVEWGKLYNDPVNKWKIKNLFKSQPTAILLKVEELMQMPGYIIDKKYLKDL